jgi:flagellar motor switch protein FliG
MQDGIKKAATFLSGLDAKTIDVLIQRFDADTAAAVRKELLAMKSVSPNEQEKITAEFVRSRDHRAPVSSVSNGANNVVTNNKIDTLQLSAAGRNASRNVVMPQLQQPPQIKNANTLATTNVTGSIVENVANNPNNESGHFQFLADTSSEQLSALLMPERPSIIALVLVHVSPDVAAETIAAFPSALQIEVVRCMDSLEDTDDNILNEVETAIKKRKDEMKPRRKIGATAIRNILKAADNDTRKNLMAYLETESLTSRRREYFHFEDLELMGDDDLAILFASVDRRIGMISLLGAEPKFINRIVGRYTPAVQRSLKHQLDALQPIRSEDIIEARKVVMDEVARLANRKTELV